MNTRLLPVGIALLITVGFTPEATADPSVWAMARTPRTFQSEQLRQRVDENLARYRPERRKLLGDASTLPLVDARRRLEEARAHDAPEPGLRFRLAQVLYELGSSRHDRLMLSRAAALFHSVARSSAPVSRRADAYNQLAIAYAKLGRHSDESHAYQGALALEPIPQRRSVLLSNQAESHMAQGDLTAAITGYRASLAITPTRIAHIRNVTTHWGLAVALDRSGDLARAFEQIAQARTYDPVDARLKEDTWFFVPAYDRYWYEALGHWHHARRSARRTAARREALRLAIHAWRTYLSMAPQNDRWINLADSRLGQCEQQLTQATAPTP